MGGRGASSSRSAVTAGYHNLELRKNNPYRYYTSERIAEQQRRVDADIKKYQTQKAVAEKLMSSSTLPSLVTKQKRKLTTANKSLKKLNFQWAQMEYAKSHRTQNSPF